MGVRLRKLTKLASFTLPNHTCTTYSIFNTSSEKSQYVLDNSTCTTSLAIGNTLTLLMYMNLTSSFMVLSDLTNSVTHPLDAYPRLY